MIQINNCDNVMITGVTLQNSPNYTVSVTDSRNVDIIGIKINSFASDRRAPNDDGIDLFNSRFVHISDCDIQNGDDSLCLFGSEDVTVTNCTLSSHDSAIRIGYDGGETRNSVFSNLVIRNSTRGINVNVRAGGVIENLLFNNIVIQTQLHTGYWWGKGEPIHISAVPQAGTKIPGVIRNLRFSNILADSEAGILIYGTKESIIRDIQFDRVKLKVKAGPMTEFVGGNFDLRGDVPQELSIFKHDIPGLYGRYVDGLKLSNFEVEWEGKLPEFFSHGIECENFRNLEVDGFVGRQAQAEGKNSAISLSNGSGVTIRDSVAAEGTQTFLGPHRDNRRHPSVQQRPVAGQGCDQPGKGGTDAVGQHHAPQQSARVTTPHGTAQHGQARTHFLGQDESIQGDPANSQRFSNSRSLRVWARLTGISVCLRSSILSW